MRPNNWAVFSISFALNRLRGRLSRRATPIFDFRHVTPVLTHVPALLDQLIAKLLFDVSCARQAGRRSITRRTPDRVRVLSIRVV
jgi:hypothetical protein